MIAVFGARKRHKDPPLDYGTETAEMNRFIGGNGAAPRSVIGAHAGC
jgi:hypothetical protein